MEEKRYNQRSTPGFGLWDRVKQCSPGVLAAFLAAFIFGYVIHLYAFTNTIPNPDGLSRIYDTQQMTISGRWFLHYASYFHGFVQSPALIGFLSVLFLALAAAVIRPEIADHIAPLTAGVDDVMICNVFAYNGNSLGEKGFIRYFESKNRAKSGETEAEDGDMNG